MDREIDRLLQTHGARRGPLRSLSRVAVTGMVLLFRSRCLMICDELSWIFLPVFTVKFIKKNIPFRYFQIFTINIYIIFNDYSYILSKLLSTVRFILLLINYLKSWYIISQVVLTLLFIVLALRSNSPFLLTSRLRASLMFMVAR